MLGFGLNKNNFFFTDKFYKTYITDHLHGVLRGGHRKHNMLNQKSSL